jgi:hypothetical protein
VVRERSAKPLCVGSIPTRASNSFCGHLLAGRLTLLFTESSFLAERRMNCACRSEQKIDWSEVKWPLPCGLVQRNADLPIDRYITIQEGQTKWD